MSFDRACKAHSVLVCVATWNCCTIKSESSSIFLTALLSDKVTGFALFTPSSEGLSSQTDSIAEPFKSLIALYSTQ